MQFKPFSKIFYLGHRCIREIYEDEVEITEKVDGSQFGFGRYQGEIGCRSKGRMIDMDAPANLFVKAVEQVRRIEHLIPDNHLFYSEYLNKPKHNAIAYDKYPTNHIMLFGMNVLDTPFFDYDYEQLFDWSDRFGFDVAPRLFNGQLPNGIEFDFIEQLLDSESYLGGNKVEGFIVKNWEKAVNLYGQIWWPMAGKYVSEAFKEKNNAEWERKKGSGWEAFKQQYQTEARWQKAVQHLRDNGELLGEPRDIGALIKEVQRDIIDECKDEILEGLWKIFSKQLTKQATLGLPEWYKRMLAEGEIDGETN